MRILVTSAESVFSKKIISTLDNEMRVNELARMIGGIELTDKALQFAKELID